MHPPYSGPAQLGLPPVDSHQPGQGSDSSAWGKPWHDAQRSEQCRVYCYQSSLVFGRSCAALHVQEREQMVSELERLQQEEAAAAMQKKARAAALMDEVGIQ